MKVVQKEVYVCEYCNLEFSDKNKCLEHEKVFHLCPKCVHCFYLYGSEQMCDLSKECKFQPKNK